MVMPVGVAEQAVATDVPLDDGVKLMSAVSSTDQVKVVPAGNAEPDGVGTSPNVLVPPGVTPVIGIKNSPWSC